jgi:hypothetical protein
MNISSTSSVMAATSATENDNADRINILMLKKALNMQATTARILLQTLPQPVLATAGTIGTKVDTFA